MKIKFLGIKEEGTKRSGCCGRRKASRFVIRREKRMVLPSGRAITFRMGEAVDVGADDAAFLLSLNTQVMTSFQEVE